MRREKNQTKLMWNKLEIHNFYFLMWWSCFSEWIVKKLWSNKLLGEKKTDKFILRKKESMKSEQNKEEG